MMKRAWMNISGSKLLRFASLLLCVALSFSTHARELSEEVLVERFREAAIRAISRAQATGRNEIQGLQLSELKAFAKKALIVYDPLITLQQTGRRCAFWHREMKGVREIFSGKVVDLPAHIRLNKECADLSGEMLEGLAVHELIGLGFERDRKYEFTVDLLSGPLKLERPSLIELQKVQVAQGGSSTGVLGGGDGDDLRFKLEAIRALREASLDSYRGIPIELMELAVREMKVAPAADIDGDIEFRDSSVESGGAIAYVKSALYRKGTRDELRALALTTARLFLALDPSALGLDADVMKGFKDHETNLTPGTKASGLRLLYRNRAGSVAITLN